MEVRDIYKNLQGIYHFIQGFFLDEFNQPNFLGKIVKIAILYFLMKIILSVIRKFLNKRVLIGHYDDISQERRIDTIITSMYSVIRSIFYFFFAMIILDMFNVDTKSILATAGVGGVAIGFGAQSLIKDFISGFFILQENSYSEGDHVIINDREGLVERLGLRTTILKDWDGTIHTIPNGDISTISNKNKCAQWVNVPVEIAYEEDIDNALKVLTEMCEELNKLPQVTEALMPLGVSELGESGLSIIIRGWVEAGMQWDMERRVRKAAKEYLEASNIEIPYRRLVVLDE